MKMPTSEVVLGPCTICDKPPPYIVPGDPMTRVLFCQKAHLETNAFLERLGCSLSWSRKYGKLWRLPP